MKQRGYSIVIVSYKSNRETLGCLSYFGNLKGVEVVVVDNGKSKNLKKGLRKISPDIKYIRNVKNTGYGGGNNLGIKNSNGKFVLILNPDARIDRENADKLLAFMLKNKKSAVAAPRLFSDEELETPTVHGYSELTPLKGIFALSFINKVFPNNKVAQQFYRPLQNSSRGIKVDAVQGSVVMVNKELFLEAGGFDEKMFLYFEEYDLGKRLKKLGYSEHVVNESVAYHQENSSESKTPDKIFQNSRFYYFKKYFGLLPALLVEGFCRFSKFDVMFLLVFALGIFLRFFRLEENFTLHGELGHVYVELKNYMVRGILPLVGPQTSHPWMRFGPLYYWLMIPIFKYSKFNPFTPALFMASMSSLVILLNYIYVSKWMTKGSALLTSLIVSVSAPFIQLSQASMFFSLVLVLFFPFFHFFMKSLTKKKYLFAVFLIFGLMLNFHLSVLILIPPMFFCYLVLGYLKSKVFWKYFTWGMLIPVLPSLVYDAKNGFQMTKNIFLWIPYRIAGFLGFYPKNNATSDVISSNIKSLYDFIASIFTVQNQELGLIIFILVISGFFYFRSANLNARNKKLIKLFYLFLLLGYLSIFVHGKPPLHYYLPVFFIPILIIGLFLELSSNKIRFLLITVLLFAVFSSLKWSFSIYWLFMSGSHIDNGSVPYLLQKKLSDGIIKDAGSLPYNLKRMGKDDQFGGDFAENYQYLLWYLGNEPVKVGEVRIRGNSDAILTYTIVEGEFELPNQDLIFTEGGVKVYKSLLRSRI
ncbi:MAG TPA: glycosyltransferase [Patescibacteria group bacterium]|nr:glycosyltransferase [Patescibacteria group bacterium]